MNHDELAVSLAAHLRTDKRMTWCDLQLGPAGSVRPDVYAIYKSYSNPCPTAYECKVSVSDFRADITAGKWQAYLEYAGAVYFACEGNLFTKKEVPEHCGLVVYRDGHWRAAKKAVLSPITVPQDALLKLLIDGVEREGPTYRARSYSESTCLNMTSDKFGKLITRTIRDRLSVELEIRDSQYRAEQIVRIAEARAERLKTESADLVAPIRKELCEILGLPPDTQHWTIKQRVAELRDALREHPARAALRQITSSLRNVLECDGYREENGEEGEV